MIFYGLGDDSMEEYSMYFDESGNLGSKGDYFVIACIITKNHKSLHNTMKKTLKKLKKENPNLKFDGHELKASKVSKDTKKHVITRICNADIEVTYIVAEKKHIEKQFICDNNRFYNYLLKILLNNHKDKFRNNKVNLILDNKSVKIKSLNSFEDYINIHINYELRLNSNIHVEYRDSKAGNAFNVQAADYIANAISSYYEHGVMTYMPIIKSKIDVIEEFPACKFGKNLKEA